MSNFLSVATVTAALQELLLGAMREDDNVVNANVRTTRPEKVTPNAGQGVFLYLYGISPNPALRGLDLPAYRPQGSLVQKPAAAVNLSYLISFYGDEGQLVPQRLMGSVVRALHARPILTRSHIQKAKAKFPALATGDLEDAIERVRLTPIGLSLEDMSKLWSVFFQVPYLPSLAYEASVVLIEDNPLPQPSLPVRARGVYGVTFRQPRIHAAVPAAGPGEPLVLGSRLRLEGENLKGPETRVRLGVQEAAPSMVSDSEIGFPLAAPPFPPASLRAGVLPLSVVHYQPVGEDQRLTPIAESNTVGVILRPSLAAPVLLAGPAMRLTFTPPVDRAQRVSVQLLPAPGNAAAGRVIDLPSRTADALSTLDVSLTGVAPGAYLVRLRVDGAGSPLEVDKVPGSPTEGQYLGPKVTLP
jgi:hypothetical protein